MVITSSTALVSDYNAVSSAAHNTGEPIHITKNGEGDVVIMSIDAFEQRERKLEQRARILESEARRLQGEPSFSTGEVRAMLEEKYRRA